MWETRGLSGPYYYKKARVRGGRVRSVYVGQGPVARACAELDGLARATHAYRAAAARRAEATLDGAGGAVGALTAAVAARLAREMEARGYRYHRGEWRRPRAAGASTATVEPVVPPLPATAPLPGVSTAGREGVRAGVREGCRPGVLGRGGAPVPAPTPTGIAGVAREVLGESAGLDVEYPPGRGPVPDDETPWAATRADPDLLRQLTCGAWSLRVQLERELHDGQGDRDSPAYRAFASGARAAAEAWGDAAPLELGEVALPYLERRRLRGRLALGRAAAHAPHSGRADHAALAVAAACDEGGVDGRAAVAALVRRVRGELGWAGAPGLGRAVVDQLALARAYAELVRAAAAAEERARATPAAPTAAPLEPLLQMVTAVLPVDGALWGGASDAASLLGAPPPHGAGPGAPGAKAWATRLRRARRRLADAERLLQHARQGGLFSSEGTPGRAGAPTAAEDALAALGAPPPLEPLRGGAAEAAAQQRRRIDALQAAWPPPERIRDSELFPRPEPSPQGAPTEGGPPPDEEPPGEYLWNPFAYAPDDDADAEDPWWRLAEPHETPEELEADLAGWAPEYVTMRPTTDLALIRPPVHDSR